MLLPGSLLLLALCRAAISGVVDFQNCCKDPDTVSSSVYEDVYDTSPYYVIAVPRTPKTEQIDNICYTYFENDNGDLLNAISVVFKNGASEQYFQSITDYPDKDGVSLSRGPDCTFLDYSLERLCSGDVTLVYRCFVGVDSCTDFDTDIGCLPGVDVRLAMSKCPISNLKVDCVDCITSKLFRGNSFCGNDYIILPGLLCPQCVTEYNCRDAIRADTAKGEICVKDCCRLTPHVNSSPVPVPAPLFPPPFPVPPLPPPLPTSPLLPPPASRRFGFSNPLNYFFG